MPEHAALMLEQHIAARPQFAGKPARAQSPTTRKSRHAATSLRRPHSLAVLLNTSKCVSLATTAFLGRVTEYLQMRVTGDVDDESATAPRGGGGDSPNEATPVRKVVTPKREHFGWAPGARVPAYMLTAFSTPISRVSATSADIQQEDFDYYYDEDTANSFLFDMMAAVTLVSLAYAVYLMYPDGLAGILKHFVVVIARTTRILCHHAMSLCDMVISYHDVPVPTTAPRGRRCRASNRAATGTGRV